MKKIPNILLFTTCLITLAACNDSNVKSKSGTTDSATAQGHQHSYRCPMNCEGGKTYEKPGKCPICGMDLEHYDGGEDNGLTYKMQYSSNPAQLTAGEPATLSFTPKVVGKENEAVALDLQHEKKIHLIVVSDDLSYFEHIHPEFQADGSYQVKVLGKSDNYREGAGKNETRFGHGGNYVLFADYKPTGGVHQVEKVPLKISGPAKPVVVFKGEKLSGVSGNYTVSLQPTGGKFITGTQMHITAAVTKDGQQVDANSLENYLGAKAHMVVLSLDDKEYLHVHPGVEDGKFDLHTTFKKPGIYRGWIQFQADGTVHTIDFTMNVVRGSAEEQKTAGAAHGTTGTNHSNH